MRIAIMGAAASGKGTVAHLLAQRLRLVHLDAGLIFRGLAHIQSEKGVEWILNQKNAKKIDFKWSVATGAEFFFEGVDITAFLKSDSIAEITAKASQDFNFLTTALTMANQVANQFSNLVCDGRNAGTELIPDADYKFVLKADLRTRALRRFAQLKQHEPTLSLSRVEADMRNRDLQDESRENAPFRFPKDAIIVDSSCLTAEETVQKLIGYVN